MLTPTTPDREAARRERVDSIRDGATTRAALGILWQCKRDLLGGYIVFCFDRDRGELLEYSGATVEEAIAKARRAR